VRALDRDQRLAGVAAFALLVTMFLPWYEKNFVLRGTGRFASDNISAFGALSFVEAAIFVVALGVFALLFARGERRGFHLPGGDGTVIFAAGVWAALLLLWRVFDRPEATGLGSTVGIQWGFFFAFLAAAALAAAGWRIRAAGRPEPPNPAADPAEARTRVVRRPRAPGEQLTLEDEPPRRTP
jgi:hypothetical protein